MRTLIILEWTDPEDSMHPGLDYGRNASTLVPWPALRNSRDIGIPTDEPEGPPRCSQRSRSATTRLIHSGQKTTKAAGRPIFGVRRRLIPDFDRGFHAGMIAWRAPG